MPGLRGWGLSAAVVLTKLSSAKPDPYVAAITVPDCTVNNSRANAYINPQKTGPPVYLGVVGIWDADDGPADTCAFNLDYTIALNEINKQTTILPNRNLVPIYKDDQGSASNGFLRGMEYCGLDWASTPETITTTNASLSYWNSYVKKVDVVVGPLYSGITMNMATILGYFEINNISPCATNPGLSDDAKYPFMNRVISNDASQAHAVLALCKYYKWTKLVIAHTTTAYSTGFANAIYAVAQDYDVTVVAMVAWETGTAHADLVPQANTLKDAKGKVIMCTAHDPDCVAIRAAAKTVGIADYPYMWIYGDSGGSVSRATVGCLVTQPFTPLTDAVMSQYNTERDLWNNANMHEGFPHNSFSYYSRDSVYAAAHAFDIYDKALTECNKTNPDTTLYACDFWNNTAKAYNQTQGKMIRWILRNLVTFSGASGTVEFNRQNGDRRKEVWSVFNCKTLGASCEKVGVSEGGVFQLYPDKTVSWPGGATKIVAWPETTYNWVVFSDGIKAATFALLIITWLLVLGSVITSVILRNRPIMRMSSYKINGITAFGAGLCVSSLYTYVMDESSYLVDGALTGDWKAPLDSSCVAFPVLLVVGFSMYFGSMGVKLWRVKQIFREEQTLKKLQISDLDLILRILGFILIEVIIVVVWMVVSLPERYIYTGPELPTDDPMQFTIEKYGYCASESSLFFYIILIYNVLMVFVVSTWAYEMRNVFYKAVNDSMQIAHITLLLVVFGGFLTALCFFLPRPTDFYVFLLAGVTVISWFSIAMIYFTKFYAIASGSERSWTKASVAESVVSGGSTANSVVPSEGGI